MKLGLSLGVLCLCLASAACSSDDDDDAGTGGASGSGGKGSGGTAGGSGGVGGGAGTGGGTSGSGGESGSAGSGGSSGSAGSGGSAGAAGASGSGGSSGGAGSGGMGGAGSCCTGTEISWQPDGGNVAYRDTHRLSPCESYVRDRVPGFTDPPTLTCQQNLGGCDADVSGADVAAALEHADVVQAIAAAPVLYGCDNRPVDGQVLQIRIGGAVIVVGNDGCGGIPAGVDALATLLRALQEEQLQRGTCAEVFGN